MHRFVLFLFCILCLSGCWSEKELTSLAIAATVALDLNEKGQYVGTAQIINPSNVVSGFQGGGTSMNPPFSTISATGDTIIEVRDKMSQKVARKIYFAHTNLLIISEELAKKEGISNILEAIDRAHDFRITANVVIAQGTKASTLAKTLTTGEKISGDVIIETVKTTEQVWGENLVVTIQQLIKDLVTPGREPIISGFTLIGDEEEAPKMTSIQKTEPDAQLAADGIAIFKGSKLIGWAKGDTAKGILWIHNKIDNTSVPVKWKNKEHAIEFEVSRQNTKVSARIVNGEPIIHIKAKTEGSILEAVTIANLTDSQTIKKLESLVAKRIKKDIVAAINIAKKSNSDILGFGETLHKTDPELWKKVNKEWNENLPSLKVEVSVDAYVRRSGLRSKSFLKDMEEQGQ